MRSIIRMKPPCPRIVSTDVRKKVKSACETQLPHRVGDALTQAVLTCLDFDTLTAGMNEYESQTYFQHHVTAKIENLLGRV